MLFLCLQPLQRRCTFILREAVFQGIALLRTCKQIYSEASQVLYEENVNRNRDTFYSCCVHHFSLHGDRNFNMPTHLLPILPIKDGKTSTRQQIAASIEAVFCRKDGCFHPTFLRTDPLLGGYIKNLGPSNATFARQFFKPTATNRIR
jgi:hypothetical protein